MRVFHIHEEFFKSIAAKGKLYSRFWFYWLGEHIDEIFDNDFIEKEAKKYPKVSEIKEIYDFGIQFLQQDFKIAKVGKKKTTRVVSKEHKAVALKVLKYLNEKAGSTYDAKAQGNVVIVSDRLNDGYSISDFMVVIDKKVNDWKGTDYAKYLRPETLFGQRFHNYLNGVQDVGEKTKFDKFRESIGKAKDLIGLRDY